jgi:hypothetical protein
MAAQRSLSSARADGSAAAAAASIIGADFVAAAGAVAGSTSASSRAPSGSPAKRLCPEPPMPDAGGLMQFLQDMRREQNERADRLEREVKQQHEFYRQLEATMTRRHDDLEKTLQERHYALEQRLANDREAAEARDAEFEKRLQALEAKRPQAPPLQFPPAWQPDGSTAAGSGRTSARSGMHERWVPNLWFSAWMVPILSQFS